MNIKKLALLIPLVLAIGLGAVCERSAKDGGVFKSLDQGLTWEQKVYAGEQGRKTLSIGGLNTTTLVQDPTNSQNLFLGTESGGLWFSGNGGEQWGQVTQINSGRVRDIVFDPNNPTTVYVIRDHQILKTIDSGGSWETVYTESSGRTVVDFDLNPVSSNLLYAGLENGTLIRSNDGGNNWSVILSESKKPIVRVVVLQDQPTTILALEYERELWRSLDAGSTWERLFNDDHIKQVEGSGPILKLTQDKLNPSVLYGLSSNVGVVRSPDGGTSWEQVATLVGKDVDSISALEVDPFNSNHLYMGVGRFIHISHDRGATWTVVDSFPSNQRIVFFRVDGENQDVVYAGTKTVEEKGGLIGPQ